MSRPRATPPRPQKPTKSISHKTRDGRITKNAEQSQIITRSGRSALTLAEAPIPDHRPKRSKRAYDVLDGSSESTTQVPHEPRSRQRNAYEKERESRRLRGQPPEFGMNDAKWRRSTKPYENPQIHASRTVQALAELHYRKSQQQSKARSLKGFRSPGKQRRAVQRGARND
jgi:hypothetical protein